MPDASFKAMVQDGKMVIRDDTALNAYLWRMKNGEELELKISKKRRTRSQNQNNWYWGVVLPVISRDTGHSVEELHEIYKRRFLQPKEVNYRGKIIRLPGSTSRLSKADFFEFVERIRADAADIGIYIPEPEQHL